MFVMGRVEDGRKLGWRSKALLGLVADCLVFTVPQTPGQSLSMEPRTSIEPNATGNHVLIKSKSDSS